MSNDVEKHPYREFEHSGWERAATSYASTFEDVSKQFVPALLDAVGIATGCRLLDVACGPDVVTAAASMRGANVTGVDFSSNMVAEAKRRLPSLQFQEADAEALPFQAGVFDAVVIGFGLHHFPFPSRAIAEAWRVLRRGGKLAFTTWAPPEHHVMHKIVVGAVREAGDVGAALPVAPGGTVNEISICAQLMKAAGFDSASVRVEIIKANVMIESAQHLVDMLVAGTVRLSTTLRSQPSEKAGAICAAIDRAMAPYRDGNHFQFPVAAILGSGTK